LVNLRSNTQPRRSVAEFVYVQDPERGKQRKNKNKKNRNAQLFFSRRRAAAHLHHTLHEDRRCPYHFCTPLDFFNPTSSFGAKGLRKIFWGKCPIAVFCLYIPNLLTESHQMLIAFVDRYPHKPYRFHPHRARGSPLQGKKVGNFVNFSRFGSETPNIHGFAWNLAGPLRPAKFHANLWIVSPCGAKILKIGCWVIGIPAFARPVKTVHRNITVSWQNTGTGGNAYIRPGAVFGLSSTVFCKVLALGLLAMHQPHYKHQSPTRTVLQNMLAGKYVVADCVQTTCWKSAVQHAI